MRNVPSATWLASLLVAALSVAASAQDRYDALANSPMAENRPTAETSRLLRDELLFQRATQTYLWALPLINTLGMKVGSEQTFGAGYHVLPVWKKRLDAKTLVTTPNSDVIYAMSYLDLGKDGPMVLEAPAGLQGILLDFWQRPIPMDGGKFAGDVGLPGPDRGKGGKFLILPPGHKGAVPKGHFVYRSKTNNVFVFLRSFYQDPKDLSPGVKVMEATKIYPLGAKSPKPMQYPDASGVPANMLPRSDATAFDQLKLLVDSEGSHLGDPDWRGMLAAIGLVQGQPFQPGAPSRAILDRAAKTGYKMSRVVGFEEIHGASDQDSLATHGTVEFPMFIRPMLCEVLRDPSRLDDPRYVAEPKFGGQRVQVHVAGERITRHPMGWPGGLIAVGARRRIAYGWRRDARLVRARPLSRPGGGVPSDG